MDEKLHEINDVAKHFNVVPKTIRNWMKSGRIRGVKIGRKWYFRDSEIKRVTEPQDETKTEETGEENN